MTTHLYMLWTKVENPGQVRFLTDLTSQLGPRRPTKRHVHLKYLYALIFKDRHAVYIGTGNENRVVSRVPGTPLRYDNDDLIRYSQQALDGEYGDRRLVIIAAYWLPNPSRPGYDEEKYEKCRWLNAGWTLLNRIDIYEPVGKFQEESRAKWFRPWYKDFKAFERIRYRRYRGCSDRGLARNLARVRGVQISTHKNKR